MNNKLTLKDSLQSPTNSGDASYDSPQNEATGTLLDPIPRFPQSSGMRGEDSIEDGGE